MALTIYVKVGLLRPSTLPQGQGQGQGQGLAVARPRLQILALRPRPRPRTNITGPRFPKGKTLQNEKAPRGDANTARWLY